MSEGGEKEKNDKVARNRSVGKWPYKEKLKGHMDFSAIWFIIKPNVTKLDFHKQSMVFGIWIASSTFLDFFVYICVFFLYLLLSVFIHRWKLPPAVEIWKSVDTETVGEIRSVPLLLPWCLIRSIRCKCLLDPTTHTCTVAHNLSDCFLHLSCIQTLEDDFSSLSSLNISCSS